MLKAVCDFYDWYVIIVLRCCLFAFIVAVHVAVIMGVYRFYLFISV